MILGGTYSIIYVHKFKISWYSASPYHVVHWAHVQHMLSWLSIQKLYYHIPAAAHLPTLRITWNDSVPCVICNMLETSQIACQVIQEEQCISTLLAYSACLKVLLFSIMSSKGTWLTKVNWWYLWHIFRCINIITKTLHDKKVLMTRLSIVYIQSTYEFDGHCAINRCRQYAISGSMLYNDSPTCTIFFIAHYLSHFTFLFEPSEYDMNGLQPTKLLILVAGRYLPRCRVTWLSVSFRIGKGPLGPPRWETSCQRHVAVNKARY